MTMTSPPVLHILISRTDNIGDVILTLPLAGYLKARYPGVQIDFLCRSYAAAVVRRCRFIDRVVTLESLADPVSYFKSSGIDTIVFAFPSKSLAKAARQAGITRRIGSSHRLHHWLYCNKLVHFSRVRSSLHEAQLNFFLLRPLGLKQTLALEEIPALYGLTATKNSSVAALFSTRRFNLILHPKSNGNGREWPLSHYTELAQHLQAQPDIAVWITGSPAEGTWLTEHASALLQLPNVTNLCGQFDLDGLTSLIGAADGLIASGTGPLHLSAALGQRTLGLFPPIKPIHPARWGALGVRAQVLCHMERCAGCTDPQTCVCMSSITPTQVEEVVLEWHQQFRLSQRAESHPSRSIRASTTPP